MSCKSMFMEWMENWRKEGRQERRGEKRGREGRMEKGREGKETGGEAKRTGGEGKRTGEEGRGGMGRGGAGRGGKGRKREGRGGGRGGEGGRRTQPYLEGVPKRVSLNTYLRKGPPSVQTMKVWAGRRSLRELEKDTFWDKHVLSRFPFKNINGPWE